MLHDSVLGSFNGVLTGSNRKTIVAAGLVAAALGSYSLLPAQGQGPCTADQYNSCLSSCSQMGQSLIGCAHQGMSTFCTCS